MESIEPGNRRVVQIAENVEMAFRWCPPGEVLMGASVAQVKTLVVLTQGFWMSEVPVTQGQWEAVMRTKLSDFAAMVSREAQEHFAATRLSLLTRLEDRDAIIRYLGSLFGEGPNYPIYYISWEDAKAFCEAVLRSTGLDVRLPTEAQWEYACRAGSTYLFFFGESESLLERYAWYSGNSRGSTHPVGELMPNAWGVRDMNGNVWEWCEDWCGSLPGGSVDDWVQSQPDSEDWSRIIRGGSFESEPDECEASFREIGYTSFERLHNLGFRVMAPFLPDN